MRNHLNSRRIRALAVAVAAAGSLGLLSAPAYAAGNAGSTFHDSFPAAGAVFTCTSGDLTATSGVVNEVIHQSVDATGIFHVTGTITIHDVTLADAAGGTYTISGASWFGGNFSGDTPIVFTSTDFFVIHGADGGVFAKVQVVEHLSPNGKVLSFDFGNCEEPED
jgi:hypothetical protein